MVATAKTAGRPRRARGAVMPARRLFTYDEYMRMSEVGILRKAERVELIEGEILLMASQGPRHNGCIYWLDDQFHAHLSGRAIISVQSTMRLSSSTTPEPDIMLLKHRDDFYRTRHAGPDDVLLMIEVAESSLPYDRGVKQRLYAEAGIREFWIVDITGQQVLIYRGLENRRYTEPSAAKRGESISPLAFPDLTLAVSDILG